VTGRGRKKERACWVVDGQEGEIGRRNIGRTEDNL